MSKNLNFFAKHKLDQFCQRRSKLSNNVDHVAGVLGVVVLKKRKYICVTVVSGFTIVTVVTGFTIVTVVTGFTIETVITGVIGVTVVTAVIVVKVVAGFTIVTAVIVVKVVTVVTVGTGSPDCFDSSASSDTCNSYCSYNL
jgi:hypothetical protein